MHAGRQYSLKEFLIWTRNEIFRLFIISAIPTALYQLFDWHWLAIPWVPIAMIGTAAAFIAGFRNTQTYSRLWEARQIYGSIVNQSRAWGMMVKDFIKDETAHKPLIYRHIAWLTALRFQLRETRTWENTQKRYNVEYKRFYIIPEWQSKKEDELKPFLSDEDLQHCLQKKNCATHLIKLQSTHLKELHEKGQLDTLYHIELENMLVNLYEQQGKCERIKNFPYPRQFASINLFFIRLFTFIVPFGLLNEFQKLGDVYVWLNIPFSLIVAWVFMSLERVGEATENPFEGSANDVPITALSRTIEIDLREMLNEKELPPPVTPVNNILM
ncbi:bestrophin family protein [Lacibacter sp.]|uniref:bestrophin family protein n=1 Tax=Lacibacter sp. TaxID=1915409 RepID=UPI002B4B1AC9|nr:bestrophin family ion channel [Lacibacter sp.]HLP35541.1 bestrophin family ion channel [Lacibacter sp.]